MCDKTWIEGFINGMIQAQESSLELLKQDLKSNDKKIQKTKWESSDDLGMKFRKRKRVDNALAEIAKINTNIMIVEAKLEQLNYIRNMLMEKA